MHRRPMLLAIIATATLAVAAAAARWFEFSPAWPPDCEAPRSGWVAQPAGAWSAMFLIAAALWIAQTARRPAENVVALATALSGAAAFLFHAAPSETTAHLDALGVAVVTASLAASVWANGPWTGIALSLSTTAGSLIVPGALEAIALGFGGVAAVGAIVSGADRTLMMATALSLAFGGILWLGGGATGFLCRPASILQPHAAWHLLAAVSIGTVVAALRTRSAPRHRLYSVA